MSASLDQAIADALVTADDEIAELRPEAERIIARLRRLRGATNSLRKQRDESQADWAWFDDLLSGKKKRS